MLLRHEMKMYPPRVKMTVIVKNTHAVKIPMKFEGCTSDSKLDMELAFLPGSTYPNLLSIANKLCY